MDSRITEAGLVITLDPGMYSEDVVFKCFYWYSGIYDIDVTATPDAIKVELLSKSGQTIDGISLLEKIRRDLIDFKLRDIVTKETQTIRELIIAKAFAYADLAQIPATDVSDPVGFNPELIH